MSLIKGLLIRIEKLFPSLVSGIQDRLGICVVNGPLSYHEDGVTSIHNCDFINDAKFQRAYSLGKQTGSWKDWELRWRAYVICWAAKQGLGLDGDFVECGVNRGGNARTLIDYVDFENSGKKFYLLDTFNGLDDELITDAERVRGVKGGQYDDCYEDVQKTFAPFSNVCIVRGRIPETLIQVPSEKIAFLSIDMNCVAPEVAAAEYFWPKLSSGAIIVLDDYGWRASIEQKLGFDAFARERGLLVLPLPNGQGIIIKP